MDDTNEIAGKIERAIIQSRLQELALMLATDHSDRVSRISQALSRLRPGAYLAGTGPSTVGLIPLTVDEVVLGRAATPLEEPAETVIDYYVADTMYFAPREVSRTHVKVVRRITGQGASFSAVDLGSSCGTYVNGQRIGQDNNGHALSHGDVVSLGPHHVSTYQFIKIEDR